MSDSVEHALRPATATDRDFVFELVLATARPHVEATWGWDDDILAAVEQDFERWFNPPASGQVVQVDGRDAGYLKVEPRDGELLLEMIMLAPEWHGRGLGTAILTPLLADARKRMLPVVLQVMKVNPATRLYERLGFAVVEELPHHFVMRWTPEGEGR